MATRGRDVVGALDDRDGAPVIDEDIGSPAGKLVYLYLRVNGDATPEELKRELGMPKIRLYPILKSLQDREFVVLSDGKYAIPE